MGFLDNLSDQRKQEEDGKEAVAAMRNKALAAVAELLREIRGCFGDDPKAHGIQINSATFPVTGDGGPYHAEGLKIIFDQRRFIQVQPTGMAFGGFRVDIVFQGCVDNQSHTLLYARQEGSEERVWAFSRKNTFGHPELKRWTKEEFEEILNRQVIGQRATVK